MVNFTPPPDTRTKKDKKNNKKNKDDDEDLLGDVDDVRADVYVEIRLINWFILRIATVV